MRSLIDAARGLEPADQLFTNLILFNPFSCEWENTSFAVKDGYVVGTGDYDAVKITDLGGSKVIPGLIDAHVHIESSLLKPVEYGRLVIRHGTTTVIADPHEIANVAGTEGISYMRDESRKTPLDILFMLPSCVPATPLDMGGAELKADDLRPFVGLPDVIGIAEMMNVPGVLAGDDEVWKKLSLCDMTDGHAPLLTGKDLNAYILAGIRTEHECTGVEEGREKLRKGMYLLMREGSTEHNLKSLIPLVNEYTVSRCCFATDDRHADMLVQEGHIDDCIRKAILYGLKPELAYRMATLSAAGCYGLRDRGAIAPGMLANFCVIDDSEEFQVLKTFLRGSEFADPGHRPSTVIDRKFRCAPLTGEALELHGSGPARVISLVPGQIITENQVTRLDASSVPDTERDILKMVVCDRYRSAGSGVGLVHGFGLQKGAIACSVSHDSHNIVAAGVDDPDIIRAVSEVASRDGGMAVASGGEVTFLPLECGGLMSSRSYEEVVECMAQLESHVIRLGGIKNPFMYLSFLALTVIPHLRLTERGLFDVDAFEDVSLFLE